MCSSDCRETRFSFEDVGAIIDRPPKNIVFRIFRRKISLFSPYGDGLSWSKIRGRSMIAPTVLFRKAEEHITQMCSFLRLSDTLAVQHGFHQLVVVIAQLQQEEGLVLPQKVQEDFVALPFGQAVQEGTRDPLQIAFVALL